MYCTVIKERTVENTRLWLVFSTFPSCSKFPVLFYRSVIHGLGFFIFFKYNRIINIKEELRFTKKRLSLFNTNNVIEGVY